MQIVLHNKAFILRRVSILRKLTYFLIMSKRVELPTHDADGPIDYLEEDPEIPNQRYCIISFLSPEKILKQKNDYFFERFVQWMDYDWKVKGLEHLADYLSKKYSIKIDDIMKDIHAFEKTHREDIKKTNVPEQYQVFLLKHEKEIQEMFDKEHNYQCNTRGVKVRRAFPSYEEAQLWCKVLQRKYPKDNLVIGRVGCWLPWEPSEHLMENVEYANAQLNEIMRRYKENEANKELFFAEEREEAVRRQKEENAKRNSSALEDASKPVHPSEGAMRTD
jgi:Family of unknown function (DUF5832)